MREDAQPHRARGPVVGRRRRTAGLAAHDRGVVGAGEGVVVHGPRGGRPDPASDASSSWGGSIGRSPPTSTGSAGVTRTGSSPRSPSWSTAPGRICTRTKRAAPVRAVLPELAAGVRRVVAAVRGVRTPRPARRSWNAWTPPARVRPRSTPARTLSLIRRMGRGGGGPRGRARPSGCIRRVCTAAAPARSPATAATPTPTKATTRSTTTTRAARAVVVGRGSGGRVRRCWCSPRSTGWLRTCAPHPPPTSRSCCGAPPAVRSRLSDAAVQRLACDATLRQVLTDGHDVLGVAAPTETIPTRVRAALWARDAGCQVPGVSRRRRSGPTGITCAGAQRAGRPPSRTWCLVVSGGTIGRCTRAAGG